MGVAGSVNYRRRFFAGIAGPNMTIELWIQKGKIENKLNYNGAGI